MPVKTLLFLLSILITSPVFGATYTVTQDGSGADYSAATFNALTGDKHGDTFYFSGTITTRLTPQIYGTSEGNVVLDGYEAGDCDPLNSVCSSSALLNGVNGGVTIDGKDYITIQDFRGTEGPWGLQIIRIAATTSTVSDYITVQRNYLYDSNTNLFIAKGYDTTYKATNITISGNKIIGFGKAVDSAQGFSIEKATNVIVSGNIIAHSGATECTSASVIEVHESQYVMFEKNDIYGAPQQAGIAVKEYGSQDIIIRFNKIHNNGVTEMGRGIGVNWPTTERVYIYGNSIYSNADYAIDVFDGAQDVYIWSNLIYDHDRQGIVAWWLSGRCLGEDCAHSDGLYIYNNTLVDNATSATGSDEYTWAGVALKDTGATVIRIKNNILSNNRPNASTYQQVTVMSGLEGDVQLEHNQYFFTGQTPTVYYASDFRTVPTLVSSYWMEDDLPVGAVGDPGFTNAGTDDYTLNGSLVDTGADLSGSPGNVTIQGTLYTLYYDDAIDPANTDWSTTPPTVAMLDQDAYGAGWDRGAYVYSTPLPSVSIAADGATISESGETSETFTLTCVGDDCDALEVAYTMSGTATITDDYTITASPATISGTTAEITVTAVDDETDDDNETVTVIITPSANYSIGVGSDTVTIIDDDTPPPGNGMAVLGGSGTMTLGGSGVLTIYVEE